MKYINRSLAFFASIILLLCSSCLKDKDVDKGRIGVHPDENSKIVEIAGPLNSFNNVNLDVSANDTTLTIVTVRLASAEPANNDIQVTLQLEPALVTAYNIKNSTAYQVPTANLYTIPDFKVIIPKGEREGYLKFKTVPNNLVGVEYAIGFSVASVSDPSVAISGNYGKQVIAIGIKNKYHATYRAVGFFAHPTAPRNINADKDLSTINGTTSEMVLGDLTGTHVLVTVNADNTVTIGPGRGTSGTTASVALMSDDNIYNNTYDPSTRTFKLKYGYPMPGPTRIITETLTRK